MSRDARAPRVAVADTSGCEACVHCKATMLFTLCTHPNASYVMDGNTEFHTIQHMRDQFVGECGSEMRLRKVETPQPAAKSDKRKWNRDWVGNL